MAPEDRFPGQLSNKHGRRSDTRRTPSNAWGMRCIGFMNTVLRVRADVLGQIERFQADCLLFFKGRIGVDPGDAQAVLRPDPSRLLEVLRRSPVPGYLWYYDRVHGYDTEPSRLEWMRQVAPHCRVAFVTDGGLATTGWATGTC